MADFFSRLSYSFGNEDWQTEQKALHLLPTDRILSITASGDRPLNLLEKDCSEIICVDANPIQNNLLKLKIAAMKAFDYEDYLGFLGVREDKRRMEKMLALRTHLDEDAWTFWNEKRRMIRKGIVYQGKMEKYTRWVARFIRLFRRDKVQRLFEIQDLEEQQAFIQTIWDTPGWRKICSFLGSPKFINNALGDPGTYLNLERDMTVANYLYKRIHQSLLNRPVKTNPILTLLFLGEVLPEGFPPYLHPTAFEKIRQRLDKIKIETSCIVEFLEKQDPNTFDCFSLSDVASYIPYDKFEKMMEHILRSSRKGARFCLRQFMSAHTIPNHLGDYFERDQELEKILEEEDRCFVYRFFAGKIQAQHEAASKVQPIGISKFSCPLPCPSPSPIL